MELSELSVNDNFHNLVKSCRGYEVGDIELGNPKDGFPESYWDKMEILYGLEEEFGLDLNLESDEMINLSCNGTIKDLICYIKREMSQ